MRKYWSVFTLCALVFLLLFAFSACRKGLDGKDGKNGADGKNAVIEIEENGDILVDGKNTGYLFRKNDTTVRIFTEGSVYGTASGGGSYPYGTAVLLRAEPQKFGTFIGWRDAAVRLSAAKKNF